MEHRWIEVALTTGTSRANGSDLLPIFPLAALGPAAINLSYKAGPAGFS
jgi:hypothetical protein